MTDGARPTSTDLMAVLEDVKKGMGELRADVSKLVQSRDNHERRIAALEPIRESFREILSCNDQILRELNALRESQETLVKDMSERVERSLREDVLGLRKDLRTDMAALRTAVGDLTERLDSRPCVATGAETCEAHEPEARPRPQEHTEEKHA